MEDDKKIVKKEKVSAPALINLEEDSGKGLTRKQ